VVGGLTLAAIVVLALRCYQVLATKSGEAVDVIEVHRLNSSARGAAV
jgi:hypothetical protein